MATIIKTATSTCSRGKVAVLGYGSQGHAHALNLHDSGIEVEVGLRADSPSRAAAEEAGLTVRTVAEASAGAQVVAILVPDHAQPALYATRSRRTSRRAPRCSSRTASTSTSAASSPPAGHDVIMVAPKGPGPPRPRGSTTEGTARPALVAVAAGRERPGARARARLRRRRSAAAARGLLETTFAEETETDLFGEQAVLCGGVTR